MSVTISQQEATEALEKIDRLVTDGLEGVSNSLAYRVHEIEKHLHSAGRFFGNSGVVDATAELMSLTPWNLVSGTGTYGTQVQLFLGDEDFDLPFTPVKFDPHRLFVEDASADGLYKIRIANSGWTGSAHTYATMDLAVAAGQYTESLIAISDNKKPEGSIEIQTGRAAYGSKLWAEVWSSVNGADVDILIGVHAYVG